MLKLLLLAAGGIPVAALAQAPPPDTFLFDFGATFPSDYPTIVVQSERARAVGYPVGQDSVVHVGSLEIVEGFFGAHQQGMPNARVAQWDLGTAASSDGYFGRSRDDDEVPLPPARLRLDLTADTVDLRFFGSVLLLGGDLPTCFTVYSTNSDTTTACLQAAVNAAETADLRWVCPRDDAGDPIREPITIIVEAGPDNDGALGRYYLNALQVVYRPLEIAALPTTNSYPTSITSETYWQVGDTVSFRYYTETNRRKTFKLSVDGGQTFTALGSSREPLPPWVVAPALPSDEAVLYVCEEGEDCAPSPRFRIADTEESCTVVVIGGTAAAGTETNNPLDSSWVARFRRDFTLNDSRRRVVNLARRFQGLASLLPTSSDPAADPTGNIDTALALDPEVVIVDASHAGDSVEVEAALGTLATLSEAAAAAGVPLYVTTPQPASGAIADREARRALRDAIFERFGERAIDFYTPIGDGAVAAAFRQSRTRYANDAAHRRFYRQVLAKALARHLSCATTSGLFVRTASAKTLAVTLSPNPATDGGVVAAINVPVSGNLTLVIYDALGRVRYERTTPQAPAGDHALHVDDLALPTGIYHINVRVGDGADRYEGQVTLVVQ